MKVDENNFGVLQDAYNITGSKSNIYWKDAENLEGYIDTDEVIDLMEELIECYEKLRQDMIDLEEDIKENYELKKINYYDIYGLNENDFH